MDDMPETLASDTCSPRAPLWGTAALANYAGLLLVLVALVALFSFRSEHFFTLRTLATVANQIPDLTVIAVGMTLVLIIGGIDLSVGSVLALGAAVLGVAMVDWQWPVWAAAALCLGAGLLCGLANGVISVGWSIPAFIVTLGMLEIARGCAYFVTDSQTMYIGTQIEGIAAPLEGLGISAAFLVAVAVVIAGQFVLSGTVFGRYMMAIGHNEQVVRYSGINPRPTKIAVFAIAGVERALRDAMRRDRARVKILRTSPFGLIEMTRQRVRPSLKRSVYMDCPCCSGRAVVKKAESMAIEVVRMLMLASQQPGAARVTVRVNDEVASYLNNKKRKELTRLEDDGKLVVQILGGEGLYPEHLELDCRDKDGREIALPV